MHGHELLADQKSAFSSEILGFEQPLRELVEFLFLPSFMIKLHQLDAGVDRFIKQGSNENGLLSVGKLNADHPQTDGSGNGLAPRLALFDEDVRRMDDKDVVNASAVQEGPDLFEHPGYRQIVDTTFSKNCSIVMQSP